MEKACHAQALVGARLRAIGAARRTETLIASKRAPTGAAAPIPEDPATRPSPQPRSFRPSSPRNLRRAPALCIALFAHDAAVG